MYLKFHAHNTWMFRGPLTDVNIYAFAEKKTETKGDEYGSSCAVWFERESDIDIKNADEIWDGPPMRGDGPIPPPKYTLIEGKDGSGTRKCYALMNCTAFLLSNEGRTLERLRT